MDGAGSAEKPSVCGASCGEFDGKRVVLLAGGKEWYVIVASLSHFADYSYVYFPSHWLQSSSLGAQVLIVKRSREE